MELLNPKLTIQNTDQPWWLIRMEHRISECESLDIQLKVLRLPSSPLADVQAQLLRQTIDLLQKMLVRSSRSPDTPAAG